MLNRIAAARHRTPSPSLLPLSLVLEFCVGTILDKLLRMSIATLPEELRPLVHREVDALDDIGLETVHRVILRMRMEESLGRLDGMADKTREKGVMERLPQVIAEVRARRRAQA